MRLVWQDLNCVLHSTLTVPVDDKDVQINQQQRRIESLEESCQDLEGTIGQFRELVLQLQS